MNLAVNVSFCVIYDAVIEMLWQSNVRHKIIGVNGAARLDVLVNLTVKHGPFAIRDHGRPDFTFAVEQSKNFSFATNPARVEFPTPCAPDMHVSRLAADEGFIHFDFASRSAKFN